MPKYLDQDGVAYLWSKIKNLHKDTLTYQANPTAYWNTERDKISDKGVLYIYTDYKHARDESGKEMDIFIPGIKIGDGITYLIDLPFLNDTEFEKFFWDHVNNNIIHITAEQREFWNNKLNYEISDEDIENLILNRD